MDPNNPDRHIQQGAEKVKRALMFGHRPSRDTVETLCWTTSITQQSSTKGDNHGRLCANDPAGTDHGEPLAAVLEPDRFRAQLGRQSGCRNAASARARELTIFVQLH